MMLNARDAQQIRSREGHLPADLGIDVSCEEGHDGQKRLEHYVKCTLLSFLRSSGGSWSGDKERAGKVNATWNK